MFEIYQGARQPIEGSRRYDRCLSRPWCLQVLQVWLLDLELERFPLFALTLPFDSIDSVSDLS